MAIIPALIPAPIVALIVAPIVALPVVGSLVVVLLDTTKMALSD
jgi:hypothetical protein